MRGRIHQRGRAVGRGEAARFFSVANMLSLSRLPLGALFALTLAEPWSARWWPPFAVVAVAGLTDVLDGWFARRALARETGQRGNPTGVGSWLDPICDKVFVAAVLGAIWFHVRPPLGWLALIVARELAQLPLSLIYVVVPPLRRWLRYDFRASPVGKAATVAQFAAIAALILRHPIAHALAIASFAIGMIALGDYVRRAVRIGRERMMVAEGHDGPRRETGVFLPAGAPRLGTGETVREDGARHAAS